MPLKKIKIITLVISYCLFLILLFSETFISDFQEVRRNLMVNSEKKTETLYIPVSVWEHFTNKNEFNYNGNYYDTKFVNHQKNLIKVEVVKDGFEHAITFFTKQIHSKNKKNQSANIKKNILPYYIPSEYKKTAANWIAKDSFITYSDLYKNKYSLFLFRPPSLI